MYIHCKIDLRKKGTNNSCHARSLTMTGIQQLMSSADSDKPLKNKDMKELRFMKRGVIRNSGRI